MMKVEAATMVLPMEVRRLSLTGLGIPIKLIPSMEVTITSIWVTGSHTISSQSHSGQTSMP